MRVVPYVSFNGTCEEAIRFYQGALGGSVDLIRFDALPDDAGVSVGDAWKAKIMHGALTLDTGVLVYFGDTWEDAPVEVGSNTTVHIEVDDEDNVARFVDKYGVHWGIEYEHPEADAHN